jgi:hypothetical protein
MKLIKYKDQYHNDAYRVIANKEKIVCLGAKSSFKHIEQLLWFIGAKVTYAICSDHPKYTVLQEFNTFEELEKLYPEYYI